MIKQFLLTVHIGGAILTLGLIVLGFVSIAMKAERYYKNFAVAIGALGGFQLISGSLVSIIGNGSLISFCTRIGLYLSAILIAEAVLFFAMKKAVILFPKKLVFVPLSAGTLTAIAAIFILIT